MVFAHLIGGGFRAAGARARDLDPAHRRDGAGFGVLAAALVIAGGVWWRLPGPIGPGIVAVVRGMVGSGAVVVPVLLVALAWRILRHPDRVSASGRIVIGWGALSFGVLGLLHIAHGSPEPSLGATAVRHAGGTVGFMVAAPLESGLTVWLAVPLLGLLAAFGVLVVTATPVNGIPKRLMELRDKLLRRTPTDPDALVVDLDAEAPAAHKRGSRRRRVGVFSDTDDAGDDRPFDTPLIAEGLVPDLTIDLTDAATTSDGSDAGSATSDTGVLRRAGGGGLRRRGDRRCRAGSGWTGGADRSGAAVGLRSRVRRVGGTRPGGAARRGGQPAG